MVFLISVLPCLMPQVTAHGLCVNLGTCFILELSDTKNVSVTSAQIELTTQHTWNIRISAPFPFKTAIPLSQLMVAVAV